MFYPAEILSLAGSVLLQINLFLFCTVCARLIKISPVSWLHEEGRTPVQMRQTPSLSSPPRQLYLCEHSPIILLVWASWFKADFSPPPPPCTHIPHTLPLHSFCDFLVECVCECASGACALRQLYITMATLRREADREENRETQREAAQEMTIWGLKDTGIDRTEEERSPGPRETILLKIAWQWLQV